MRQQIVRVLFQQPVDLALDGCMDGQSDGRAGLEHRLDGAAPAGQARVRDFGTDGREGAAHIAPLPQVLAQIQRAEKEMAQLGFDATQRPASGTGGVVLDDLPVVGWHGAAVQLIPQRLYVGPAQQRQLVPRAHQRLGIVQRQAGQALGVGGDGVAGVAQQRGKLIGACRRQLSGRPPFALRQLVMHRQQAGADAVRQRRPMQAGDGRTRPGLSHDARRPHR